MAARSRRKPARSVVFPPARSPATWLFSVWQLSVLGLGDALPVSRTHLLLHLMLGRDSRVRSPRMTALPATHALQPHGSAHGMRSRTHIFLGHADATLGCVPHAWQPCL